MRWLQLALNVRDAQVRVATHPDSPEVLQGFHLHLLRLLDAVQEELDALPCPEVRTGEGRPEGRRSPGS
jgi:hypothetical protein